MLKITVFNYKIKLEIKATATTAITNKLKNPPMSEGNTCIAQLNLEVITLKIIQQGNSLAFFVKSFEK